MMLSEISRTRLFGVPAFRPEPTGLNRLRSNFVFIYSHHADEYDALVSAEDCDGNLLRTLLAIASPDGRTLATTRARELTERELLRPGAGSIRRKAVAPGPIHPESSAIPKMPLRRRA